MLALNPENVRQYYGKLLDTRTADYGERYDPNLLENRPQVAKLVSKLFNQFYPESAGRLLDIGCGTGFYFPLLAKKCETLTGIDLSPAMLEELQCLVRHKQLSNCKVYHASAQELPFLDNSFDQVFSWDFLHHTDALEKVFSEIHRVLKPGGRYLVIEPNIVNPTIFYYHVRRPSEWGLLRNNQWTLVKHLKSFKRVRVHYDNTVISFLNEGSEWLWKLAEVLTSLKASRYLKFRYLLEIER